MRFGRAAGWVAVLTVSTWSMAAPAGATPVGHTVRVDVSTGGVVGNGDTDTSGIGISANGHLIAFSSSAPNLVSGDTNGMRDVFVRNVRTGTTTRVDVGPGNAQANGDSFGPLAISGDGRFVAFESDSSNLVAGSCCTPGQAPDCLFIRDRTNGTTRVIKRIQNPEIVALSEHGRYLVTAAFVGQLVRIDLHTGTMVRVSCCGLGTDLKNLSFGGMSASANLVTFGINTGSSDPGNPFLYEVYVRNIARGRTTLVSRASDGAIGNRSSLAGGISPGGRYVIFTSSSTNLVPHDTNGRFDVFVCDRWRATTSRVDVRLGNQANGDGQALAISAGGRYRVFASTATNLVRSDTNHAADIFIRDRRTRRTYRVDLTATSRQANHGVGKDQALGFAMTPGARWMAFVSASTNMILPATNSFEHTYLRGPLY